MTQHTSQIGADQSGIDYRNQDNDGKKAILNHHKGSSAPAYAEAGIIWLDDSSTPWLLKSYDGADWITLGAINAIANTFNPYIGTAPLRMLNHASDTGSANTYVVAPAPAATSYTTGMIITLKPANATTGASTINVSSLGTKNIKTILGKDPVANTMVTTGVYFLYYDGTNFIILNSTGTGLGASIASGSTVNLDNATGDHVHVTGTTGISTITLAQGREVTVTFDGALTITHGSSLIMPGAANYTTVAGDTFTFRGEASSVVRVVSYILTSGKALVAASVSGGATTTSTGSNVTLTSSSDANQYVAMTAAAKCVNLPDATTLELGKKYRIRNTGLYRFAVRANGGTFVTCLYPNQECEVTCSNISSAAGVWYSDGGTAGMVSDFMAVTTTTSNSPTTGAAVGIDGTYVLSVYNKGETPKLYATVSTINTDGTLTKNTEYDTGFTGRSGYPVRAVLLDSTHALVTYVTSVTPFHCFAFVVSISGTSLTFGSAADVGHVTSTAAKNQILRKLDSSTVILADSTSSSSSRFIAMSISGTTVTPGTATTLSCNGIHDMQVISSSLVIFLYTSSSTAFVTRVNTASISGTTVTLGTLQSLDAGPFSSYRGTLAVISSTLAIANYGYTSTAISMSGAALTLVSTVATGLSSAYAGSYPMNSEWCEVADDGSIVQYFPGDGSQVFSSMYINQYESDRITGLAAASRFAETMYPQPNTLTDLMNYGVSPAFESNGTRMSAKKYAMSTMDAGHNNPYNFGIRTIEWA